VTPAHSDIACVLESVKGVLGVYAVERPTRRHEALIDTIVGEEDVRSATEAHYASSKILTHADCASIQFCQNDPSPSPMRPSPITLSSSARAAVMRPVTLSALAAILTSRRTESVP
jgi:hypothetical protein